MLSLNHWRPLSEMTNIDYEVDGVIERFFGERVGTENRSWLPPMEATAGNDGWKVRMALPGIEPKDVHIEVEGKLLKVSGERSARDDTTIRHMSEIGYGRFERRFALPETVAPDKVKATFEHGMLELTLPSSESAKPRRIEIESVTPTVLAEVK